jgi:hypothetical protein
VRRIRERTRRARPGIATLALAAAVAGCAVAYGPAPASWLPTPHQVSRWPYGASAVVHPVDSKAHALRGELIALHGDSVYVLTDTALVAVACRKVRAMELQVDQSNSFEAPQLVFDRSEVDRPFGIGDKTTGQSASGPISGKWESVRSFARFPAGLPDSLDRASLRLPPARR